MWRVILPGLFLRRQAYLRMVLAREGVADAAMVVAVVYLVLAVPGILGTSGLLAVAAFVVGGVFSWVALSGLTYLAGRHVLEGDGTFPSVMAATGLAFPPLVVSLLLRPFLPPRVALAASSAWLLACLWQAARVSLDLSPARAAAAAAGGYGGWLALSALSVL
ncbi:MAG: YIP1 family protein [Actinomycetota bacterium]